MAAPGQMTKVVTIRYRTGVATPEAIREEILEQGFVVR